MPPDKIRALTEQLVRSETPDVAVAVSAHLQVSIREFIEELRAKLEVMPLLPDMPIQAEQETEPN